MRPPESPDPCWPLQEVISSGMRRFSLLRRTQTHPYCGKPSNKYTNVLFLWQACTQADSCTQGHRDDVFLSSCLALAANSALPVDAFNLFFPHTHLQKGVWRQIRLLSGYWMRFRFKSYRTKIPKRSCDPAPCNPWEEPGPHKAKHPT